MGRERVHSREFEAAGSVGTRSHAASSQQPVTAGESGEPDGLTNREAGVVWSASGRSLA